MAATACDDVVLPAATTPIQGPRSARIAARQAGVGASSASQEQTVPAAKGGRRKKAANKAKRRPGPAAMRRLAGAKKGANKEVGELGLGRKCAQESINWRKPEVQALMFRMRSRKMSGKVSPAAAALPACRPALHRKRAGIRHRHTRVLGLIRLAEWQHQTCRRATLQVIADAVKQLTKKNTTHGTISRKFKMMDAGLLKPEPCT